MTDGMPNMMAVLHWDNILFFILYDFLQTEITMEN